jgi:NAD(P)-dependent dehydrogenase (short-subunit alcohol dehydrogenase family)
MMFHKMDEASWDAVIAVHLKGSFNVCRATIELFREQGDGDYVLFSSTSGLVGNVGQTNYGAAKMGIAGLSRIITLEGASKGVRSNALAPGAQTRMTDSVPIKTAEQAARRAGPPNIERSPLWPATMAVALVAPASKKVQGQVFGASGYNISLYSQPRPIASLKKDGGWSVKSICEEAFPAWEDKYTSLARGPAPAQAPAAQPAKT